MVLDIGSAPGHITKMTKQLFEYEVYGLDLKALTWYSPLANTFQRYVDDMKKSMVDILACNVDEETFPFDDEAFDVVLFTEVVEHLKKPQHALSEIYRVIKSGCTLILSTPNFNRLGNRVKALLGKSKEFHGVREYTPKELKELVESANLLIEQIIFSDWSERKWVERIPFESPKLSVYSTIKRFTKYRLVTLIPQLSSYVFVIATKVKKKLDQGSQQ